MGLLEFVFPPRCAICSLPGSELCESCQESLPRLLEPRCARCGAPLERPAASCRECRGRPLAFECAQAALLYAGTVPSLIGAWKERGRRRLARPAAALVAEIVTRPQGDALTYVPAQPERSLSRGFHPAAALATELAHLWQLPLLNSLERVGAPRRQRGLPLAQRAHNVEGAFRCRAGGSTRRALQVTAEICLVDDVYTSGATASACAHELLGAGVERVAVVALARAVRDRPRGVE